MERQERRPPQPASRKSPLRLHPGVRVTALSVHLSIFLSLYLSISLSHFPSFSLSLSLCLHIHPPSTASLSPFPPIPYLSRNPPPHRMFLAPHPSLCTSLSFPLPFFLCLRGSCIPKRMVWHVRNLAPRVTFRAPEEGVRSPLTAYWSEST